MTRSLVAVWLGVAVWTMAVASAITRAEKPSPQSAAQSTKAAASAAAQEFRTPPAPGSPQSPNAVVHRYCATCHSDKTKRGDLSLETFDIAHAAEHPDVAEKMIRKLQAGYMPPPGSQRPDAAVHAMLVGALESTMDAAAARKPNPGARTFQRLNRPEYAGAIHDLLGLDVDAGDWLPLDTKNANFDN